MAGDAGTAGLSVSFVTGLADVVPSVVAYLNDRDGRDLFETDHIVVPNAGVRAWLLQQLAFNVGASRNNDGVVAGVNVGYLGLVRSVAGGVADSDDPWAIDPLTMAVLQCLPTMANCSELCDRYNGILRAARTIADRFDSYHAHRPRMIEAWEAGRAELMPELGDRTSDGEWMVVRNPLSARDRWQFELWTKVRAVIGVPSPPAQLALLTQQLVSGEVAPTSTRLMVVGLQSIPARMVGLVKALAGRIPVEIVLVHPSPALHGTWTEEARVLQGSNGILPLRPRDGHADTAGDPLIVNWLQGSREAQQVLGSFGEIPVFRADSTGTTARGLLGHIQESIAHSPHIVPGDCTGEVPSVQVHRAHELSRQVEVLHDALLHAFTDIPGLQPHEVVILCPDMAAAAPLLTATFDRDVEVSDGRGGKRSVRIPLVVADRGLRQVSDGTQVLAQMLSIVTSRASKTSVLGLLCSPAVLRANALPADVVSLWWKIAGRTGVNWGLSGDHRVSRDADPALGNVQTWANGLRQALIGVLVPDDAARPEAGGVVPLDDLDPADFPAVAALSRLVDVLARLEQGTRQPRSVIEWTDMVESSLLSLCGSGGDLLAEPSGILRDLRRAAQAVPGSTVQHVEFAEFAALLVERAEEIPGRQPLRTGAVTATSMVPLRSVPFKVVCVLGYDEGVVGSAESESDDLAARQQFIGDVDPRIDARRAFLDAVLAAGHRFIVTCNGRSTKNNAPLPFVTPLAEFVDMCVRAGGTHDPKKQTWSFVFDHPRHAIGALNFVDGGVIPGQTFAHSVREKESSLAAGVHRPAVSHPVVPVPSDDVDEVTVRDLLEVVKRPHNFFYSTLGIPKWQDEQEADVAVLPLDVSNLTASILWRQRCEIGARWDGPTRDNLVSVLQQRGQIPVGTIGESTVDGVNDVFTAVIDEAKRWEPTVTGSEVSTVSCSVDGVQIAGDIAFVRSGTRIIMVTYKEPAELNVEAALALLLLEAQETPEHFDEAILIGWQDDAVRTKALTWKTPLTVQSATARLAALVDAVRAASSLPMFMFDKTADLIMDQVDPTEVRAAFESFVSDREYEKKREYRVFGGSPRFDDVFPAGGPLQTAWLRRASGMRRVRNNGGKAPVHPFIGEQVGRSVAQ
ncbi:MAG: exodeoxyribonuclease subunit gamma [Actinomycetota bacterium]